VIDWKLRFWCFSCTCWSKATIFICIEKHFWFVFVFAFIESIGLGCLFGSLYFGFRFSFIRVLLGKWTICFLSRSLFYLWNTIENQNCKVLKFWERHLDIVHRYMIICIYIKNGNWALHGHYNIEIDSKIVFSLP